jgi:catechol 2,3-dioxygenase-like lactoylglutathione lyase family enzyme
VTLFNHVMVGSNDLDRAKRFYDAVLGVLGAGQPVRNVAPSGHVRLIYRHAGTMFGVSQPIDGAPATVGNGTTVAFRCTSPEEVQRFHDVAIAHGGTSIEDAPGPRETSFGRAVLAYVRDPDGNKLCAVCRG